MSIRRIHCPACETEFFAANSRLVDTICCVQCGATLQFVAFPVGAIVTAFGWLVLSLAAYVVGYRGAGLAVIVACGAVLVFVLAAHLVRQSFVFRTRIVR